MVKETEIIKKTNKLNNKKINPKKTTNIKQNKTSVKDNKKLSKTIQIKPKIKRTKKTKKRKDIGEKQIESFLKEMKIKYSKKKKIHDLKQDNKKYRQPDFYLPKYNLSIEYFGSWTQKKDYFSKKEVDRFLKKVFIYHINKLDCVFIYPKYLDIAPTLILKAMNKKQKNNAYQDIMIPWMNYERIEKPLPEDFINKPLNWQLKWMERERIEKPLASDFIEERKPLNWYLPWLDEEKIDEPIASDFIKNKEKIKQKPIIKIREKPVKKENEQIDTIMSLIGLGLIIGIIILIILFIIMIINFGF